MYRFLLTPRWLVFHLLCGALVIAMVNLGLWQYDRLQQRQEFNAVVEQRQQLPPQPFEQVVQLTTDPDDVEWRAVTLVGSYLTDEQVLRVNVSQNGAPGVNVVTPLALENDGRLVLINRGFVPLASDVPPAPPGIIQITGRLRASETRRLGGLTDASGELAEIQRIDIERLAQQLPRQVAPLYVDLLEVLPPQGDVPVPLPAPKLGEGSHLAYMVQWWIFSLLVIVGWVLAIRRSVQQRKQSINSAAADVPHSAAGEDFQQQDGDEAAKASP